MKREDIKKIEKDALNKKQTVKKRKKKLSKNNTSMPSGVLLFLTALACPGRWQGVPLLTVESPSGRKEKRLEGEKVEEDT